MVRIGPGLLAFLLLGCSSDASTSSHSGALTDSGATGGTANGSGGTASGSGGASTGGKASGSGGASTGGTASGSGGASTGGASNGGGHPGTGGSANCPPECFVANSCVTACGQTPTNYGCCPCPSGTVNVFSCGAADSGTVPRGVSCDTRLVRCNMASPVCVAGQVPSIVGQCYGPCVPIDSCACAAAADCPDANQYTCHLSSQRCGPYVN